MGPFAMDDLVGLDVGWHLRQEVGRAVGHRRPALRAGPLRPEDGRRLLHIRRRPDRHAEPEVEQLIVEVATQLGITRRPISDEEILQRLSTGW